MRYKGIFLLVLILISVITISAVSASEDTASDISFIDDTGIGDIDLKAANEDVNSDDQSDDIEINPVLSEENDEGFGDENSNAKNFTYLDNLINGNEEDVINLDSNITFEMDSDENFIDGINIARPITLNGNGFTINANNQARIFHITGNVEINDLVFLNAYSSIGGSAIDTFSTSISLVNCSFINSKAYDAISQGGAIRCSGCNLSLVDCSFVNNSANLFGGAILSMDSTLSIIHSSFVSNKAGDKKESTSLGGAIHALGNISVIDSSFVDNSAHTGGAIDYTGKNISIKNCSFVNNSAYDGGAIDGGYNTNCSVADSSFENNSADYGGAIYSSQGCIWANNCSFVNNSAIEGGAIKSNNNDNDYIVNCSFVDNSAKESGGAINSWSYSFVEDCSFANNSADLDGGAICCFQRNCSFVNCSFVDNSAKEDGGAIMIDSCNPSVVMDCSFNGNTAQRNGGAALFTGNCSSCSFANNKAKIWGNDWITDDLVNKLSTVKVTASSMTVSFNNNKYLVITLTDGTGKSVIGEQVRLLVNGKEEIYTTNSNGQVKRFLGKLAVMTHMVYIEIGSLKHIPVEKDIKVIVTKATPKFVAYAKTFKRKVKIKKYTVTLKNNQNKVMKNMKVTLKVNKKKYVVRTNSKGKAIFKIKKLTRVGTYKATITFAGNQNYKKITKKVNIKVKK